MLKAVNMKNYRWGAIEWVGFGIIDTETKRFVTVDGIRPYVLATKKIMQSVIDCGWAATCHTIERPEPKAWGAK